MLGQDKVPFHIVRSLAISEPLFCEQSNIPEEDVLAEARRRIHPDTQIVFGSQPTCDASHLVLKVSSSGTSHIPRMEVLGVL